VVVFQETSIFQKVKDLWYYVEADGDVTYAGDSMADRFDSAARQAAIAQGKASRQAGSTATKNGPSKDSDSAAEGSAGEIVRPAAAEVKAAPAAAPAAEAAAAPATEADPASEMQRLRNQLMRLGL
jgi:hypothetical protein